MAEICIRPPVVEPVSLEEAKLHMRVPDTSQDARIQLLIAQARGAAEMKTRQQCLHATWKLVLDDFCGAILLPHVPVVNVVEVSYVDLGGVMQVVPASNYVVNVLPMPGVLVPAYGAAWPAVLPQAGSVSVTYNAGYASPFTVDQPNNFIIIDSPVSWEVGDMVRFSNSGGELPEPLLPGWPYTIEVKSGNSYQLNDYKDNPVTLQDAGSGISYIGIVPPGLRGWILLRTASLYENREEVAVLTRGSIAEIPFMEGLLDEFRTSIP